MKRLMIVLSLITVLFLSGCDFGKTEFEKAINAYETMESVAIEMVTAVPSYKVEVEASILIEGENALIEMEDETYYNVYSNETYYELAVFNDVYIPTEIDYEEAIGFSALGLGSEDATLEENYELVDGWYVYLLEDEEYDELKIEIIDDLIHEIFFSFEESGLEMELTLTFSDYNNVTVDLPENMVDFEDYFAAFGTISDLGIEYDMNSESLNFFGPSTSIYCSIDQAEGFCDFSEGITSWYFNVDGTNFNYMDEAYASLDDLYANASFALPKESFEAIMQVITLLFAE